MDSTRFGLRGIRRVLERFGELVQLEMGQQGADFVARHDPIVALAVLIAANEAADAVGVGVGRQRQMGLVLPGDCLGAVAVLAAVGAALTW